MAAVVAMDGGGSGNSGSAVEVLVVTLVVLLFNPRSAMIEKT